MKNKRFRLKQCGVVFLIILHLFTWFIIPVNAEGNDNKYYVFDPRVVNNGVNAELEIATVSKTITEASWLDRYAWHSSSGIPDWEHYISIMYPHVEYDSINGKYKMWYFAFYSGTTSVMGYDWTTRLIDASNSKNVELGSFVNTAKGTIYPGKDIVCYMESTDGVNWTRPQLGEFFYKNQQGEIVDTNIVFVGNHGNGVEKNENPDPNEPAYLMAGRTYETDVFYAGEPVGLAISWSDDGIHWEAPVTIKTAYECSSDIHYIRADSHNQLKWSAEANRYIIVSRGYASYNNALRQVISVQAKDTLNSIRDMATVKTQGGANYWEQTSEYWTDAVATLDYDVVYGAEPYSMPSLHVAEGYYIGILSVADFNNDGNGVWNSVHAELTWSPNGVDWYYIDKGTPIVDNAVQFEFESGNDYGMIYCAAPIVVGEEVQIYYAALPELHYTRYADVPSDMRAIIYEEVPAAGAAGAITRTPTLNVAKFGKDRYAGYQATSGIITTNSFQINGNSLKLTADVAVGGAIKVAVLDADGYVLDGFGFEDCTAITSNITDTSVTWGNKELSSLIGQSVSFQIQLNNATVYTVGGNIELLIENNFVYWADGFEDGLGEWRVRDDGNAWDDVAPYTYISLTGNTYEGNQSFGLAQAGKQVLLRKTFDGQMNKVLSVWFYDNVESTETRIMACMEQNSDSRIALGVHSATSSQNYTMWVATANSASATTYEDTGVPRTTGWHQFTWDATSGTGVDVYIDGVKIDTATTHTSFAQICLGWWTAGQSTSNAFDNVLISEILPWEIED